MSIYQADPQAPEQYQDETDSRREALQPTGLPEMPRSPSISPDDDCEEYGKAPGMGMVDAWQEPEVIKKVPAWP